MTQKQNSLLPMRGLVAGRPSGSRFLPERLAASLLFGATLTFGGLSVSAEDTVTGYWLTDKGQSIVEIAPCGNSAKRVCGNVVWIGDDANHATGDVVLKSFRPVGKKSADKWAKGKVYEAGGKKGYAGKLDIVEEGLKVSSCKGSSCRHTIWARPSSSMTAEAGLRNDGE